MKKEDILKFYKQYRNQIINEMKEYLDIPLKNIKKISDFDYLVFEDNIEAKFSIKSKYFSDSHKYFPKNIDKTYEISWSFPLDIESKYKTPQNFLRILATSYKVLKDFIENKQPNVITFSGSSKGHDSIYFGDTFLKRLRTLFGNEYDIVLDKDNSIIYIINKTISLIKNESINKRAKTTSLQESIIYWKYSHLHPTTPHNVKVKNIIKNKIIQNLYIK